MNIQKTDEKNDINSINNENNSLTDNNFVSNYDPITSPKYINNDNEDISKNILEQYNIGIKPQISDYSKNYINSYVPGSSTSSRPALSYISKQFLTTELNSDNYNKRPELSNITRAYLISQKPINENDEDK